MLALTLVILATYLIVLFCKKLNAFRRKENLLKLVPGPKPNLLFGNTLELLNSKNWFRLFRKYENKYGEIYKIYDGPLSQAVVVSDYKFIELLTSTTSKSVDKANEYRYLEKWLGTGLITSRGIKWKKRRKLLTPSFHFNILQQYVETFGEVTDILIKKLEKETTKNDLDIYPLITLCTLDIICEAAMGTSVNAQENTHSEYVASVKTMCRILSKRLPTPVPDIFFPLTPSYYQERKALNVLRTYTNSVIDKKLQEKKNEYKDIVMSNSTVKKPKAFLDTLLDCAEDGHPLSREDLQEEVDTFMFAGHDTVSSAISFMLYSLANHPHVQEKALEEQKTIFGQNWLTANVTMKELQEMKYLELVAKEVLRLYPSVPFIGKTILEDLQYDGITYPKGLSAVILIMNCHKNPKYFRDPEKFIPERFEVENHKPFSYVPFAAGHRNCIGKKFAMLEIKCVVSKILRNFLLLPAVPEHKLILMPATILISKNGVKISLKKRME